MVWLYGLVIYWSEEGAPGDGGLIAAEEWPVLTLYKNVIDSSGMSALRPGEPPGPKGCRFKGLKLDSYRLGEILLRIIALPKIFEEGAPFVPFSINLVLGRNSAIPGGEK